MKILLLAILLLSSCQQLPAIANEASYYTVASCLKESGQYRRADGKLLDDNALTFACWHLKFGTKVEFTNIRNGKKVIAVCADRGPAKRLVKRGRLFDLSKACFLRLDSLKEGVIEVRAEIVR